MNNDYIEFLVKSAKSGRKNAFMELSDFYLKKIYTLCFVITANTNISKILTKRIFVKTWDDLKEFDGGNSFSEWFYDLAIMQIYDELKTKYISSYLIEKKIDNDLNTIPENFSAVEKAIFQLDQDERFLFILHDIENYTLEKIGSIVEDVDIENLGVKLFSVRDKVLQNLDILDESEQLKLIGRYDDIIAAASSDEQSEKLEFLELGKEKHYELVHFFTTINTFQPDIIPPDEVRESIFNELFKQGLEEKSKQKKEDDLKLLARQKLRNDNLNSKEKKERFPKSKTPNTKSANKTEFKFSLPKFGSKKIVVFTIFTLIIISIAYYHTYFQKNTPWIVEVISGRYRISNGSDPSRLFEKQTLITDPNGEASVKIPDVGSIKLYEISELTLNKGVKDLSEVTLNKGTIEITSGYVISGILVHSGLTQVIDLGSNAKVTFKPPGDSRVEVNRGLVEVRQGSEIVYVTQNYINETRLGAKPGVPYNKSANYELVEELKNLQYKNGGFESLTKIINAATESDVITLWHLFSRVELTERELIFSKLNEYFGLPLGIEKRDIINLDHEKLKQWFDEIKWQL